MGRKIAKNNAIEFVVFTLEGICRDYRDSKKGGCGNNWTRYMVGVKNGKILPPIMIGGKSRFVDSSIAISENEIVLNGFHPQNGDPSCCPTKKATRKYIMTRQAFKEIAP